MKKSAPSHSRRLQYEVLERREVMAAGLTASLSAAGVLTVAGTDAADQISFRQSANVISIAGVAGSWTAAQVNSIVVDLRGGNDVVSLHSLANGGNQALAERVLVLAGSGTERVQLPTGANLYLSGSGNTLDVAANGTVKLNSVAQNLTSQITGVLSGGVLTITGTNGNDNLQFLRKNNVISLKGSTNSWAAGSITSIVVYLQDGADTVSLDSVTNGGNQSLGIAVTVNSGMGNEKVRLQTGKEVACTGLKNVIKVAAAGTTATLNGVAVNFNTPTPPSPAPTNWFDANITDAAIRALGKSLYADGKIDRNDAIALLRSAKDNAVIDSTELADLRKIVANTTLFAGLDYVRVLTSYVVNSNVANANFQGQALGNLGAGSSDVVLEKLVNKWFLGLDRPEAAGVYRQFSGSLFVSGAQYSDVHQGAVGDCYFVSALGEAALRSAASITNMFVVNGDGTYTVKFFNSAQAFYVTVDSYLPTNSNGQLIYASRGQMYNNAGNELWVALAEKAYAQLNEFGWSRAGMAASGRNSYSAIEGGYIYAAIGHITGSSTSPFAMTSSSTSFQTFVTAWNAGKMIGFASYQTTPAGSGVVGGHAYAVVGYNATNQTVTLFNPWGTEYGLLTLTWSQIQASFQYFDRTV